MHVLLSLCCPCIALAASSRLRIGLLLVVRLVVGHIYRAVLVLVGRTDGAAVALVLESIGGRELIELHAHFLAWNYNENYKFKFS